MIEFRCPQCDKRVRTRAEYAGRRAQCPKCRSIVRVPDSIGFLDDMNTEDFEHALNSPPPLPALPIPPEAILIEEVPNEPPSKAFYVTLATLVGALLLIGAFFAGRLWSDNNAATAVAIVPPMVEPAIAERKEPLHISLMRESPFVGDDAYLPGTFPNEAYRAIEEMVGKKLGPRAKIDFNSRIALDVVLVDEDLNRYWYFRGERLIDPDREVPEIDRQYAMLGRSSVAAASFRQDDQGVYTYCVAYAWYECQKQTWHLAYLSAGGIVVHHDMPKPLEEFVLTVGIDRTARQALEWNRPQVEPEF